MKGYNGVYMMGHFPEPSFFEEAAVRALERFSFLEIGVPFSDPVADGPVIANAGHEVLSRGFAFNKLIESVHRIRSRTPKGKKIYFMLYANIVHRIGAEAFARLCRDEGIAGAILPDVPGVESASFGKAFRQRGVELVHFVSPESTPSQIREAARATRGFLYFISLRGITGSALDLDGETRERIALARGLARVPVVLGFGVGSAADAAEALRHADGFIMGTRIVQEMRGADMRGFCQFLDELEAGLSRAS